jgi:hypothetical protein
MKESQKTFNNFRDECFKNWIKKRFRAEYDLRTLSPFDTLIWSVALKELSQEIVQHQIVPFNRDKGE